MRYVSPPETQRPPPSSKRRQIRDDGPKRAKNSQKLSKKKRGPVLSDRPAIILATAYSRVPYRDTTIGDRVFYVRVRKGNG